MGWRLLGEYDQGLSCSSKGRISEFGVDVFFSVKLMSSVEFDAADKTIRSVVLEDKDVPVTDIERREFEASETR